MGHTPCWFALRIERAKHGTSSIATATASRNVEFSVLSMGISLERK